MTNVIRSAGVTVSCVKASPSPCYAVSHRQGSKMALSGGNCPFDVYLDGVFQPLAYRDLERMQVNEYGAIEIYSGPATIPSEYNHTGSSCGVILMWTRER